MTCDTTTRLLVALPFAAVYVAIPIVVAGMALSKSLVLFFRVVALADGLDGKR